MVEARNSRGEPILDLQSGMPILKATNCDLCESQLGGPACARACPHDALSRVDLNQDLGSLAEWARL
jgi:Fe-S-cluster-containing hydrogenase component 2